MPAFAKASAAGSQRMRKIQGSFSAISRFWRMNRQSGISLQFAFASTRETDLKSGEMLETAVVQEYKNQSATAVINLREALEVEHLHNLRMFSA